MKQQEVFKKIGGIIREINEQYEYLETVDGVLNELELELMVANSHFLTDHIEILRKLNAHAAPAVASPPPIQPAATEPPPVTEVPQHEHSYFEPVTAQADEPEVEELPVAYQDETPADTFEFEIPKHTEDHTDHSPAPEEVAEVEEQEPEPVIEPELVIEPEPEIVPTTEQPVETIRHELTMEDIGEDWDEEEDEVPAQQPEPEPVAAKTEPEPTVSVPEPQPEPVFQKPEPEPAVVEPQPVVVVQAPTPQPAAASHTQIMVPEDQVLTLNQRMSAQLGGSRMFDHLGAQPISDLKSAISLNDKLLYIKDLFNGYGLAYSEAIDQLNRFKSFEEAESFLKASYSTKNNWQDKQATADKFYALLQRRYLA
jgi:hypothetical protein